MQLESSVRLGGPGQLAERPKALAPGRPGAPGSDNEALQSDADAAELLEQSFGER